MDGQGWDFFLANHQLLASIVYVTAYAARPLHRYAVTSDEQHGGHYPSSFVLQVVI